MGRLVQLCGERRLVVAGTVTLAVSLFALPGSGTAATLLVATAGVALGHSLMAAPINGLASQSVGAASQGRVLGLMQSAASLARIVGPVLGGALLDYDAARHVARYAQTPYWAGGGIMCVALLLAFTLQANSKGQ